MGKRKCINKHCDEGSASHSGCVLLGKHSDTQRSEGSVGSRFGLRADDTASRRTLQYVGLSASCNWTNERSWLATLFIYFQNIEPSTVAAHSVI